ncbi:glycerophosphoryl diester phosphodiesterase membrane domain-containing protein [Sphingomicrobium arenosum]|uniref:glycerophosphoryl diester phosphodiesterase membrane domain-containing protein n=1 Tax=Sphingomicrobium arenosum TaxID=2233861 RepID=UPI0022406331|nr:glycerophosphoryl diester phosphodiesterase membrane domain-containing protein [Sphingomicrobium arenosum]
MARLSISKAWDDARPIIARDGRLMFIVALATVVLPGTVLMTLSPGESQVVGSGVDVDASEGDALVTFLSFLFMLVSIIGSIAISYLALFRGASVGDALRRGLKRALVTIGMVLLLIIPMLLLFALLVVMALGTTALANFDQAMTPDTISPAAALAIIAFVLVILWVGMRLAVTTPVIAAEEGGPVAVLKRSWALTKGHFWRILGFVLLLSIGVFIFMGAVELIGGLAIQLVLGEPEPMNLAAVAHGLVSTLAQAAVTIVYSTILARIYHQLAGNAADPVVSVPAVDSGPLS